MKNLLKLVVFTLALAACRPEATDESVLQVHYNLNFVADLTNRLQDKQSRSLPHDSVLFNKFIEAYVPKILNHRRSLNQKDIIQFSAVSRYNSSSSKNKVSLEAFKNQRERIEHIKSGQLDVDLKNLETNFAELYKNVNDPSGDLFSFFKTGISKLNVKGDTIKHLQHDANTTEYHKNVVVLFTDGYLEAGSYSRTRDCNGNQCMYLNEELIEEIRGKVKQKGATINEILEQDGYGIMPVSNKWLKYCDIIIMEVFDRSRSSSGSARKNPTDYEIIKAVWEKWLLDSGAKSVKIYEVLEDVSQVDQILRSDILVK